MKEVICNISLYALHQRVYLVDKEQSSVKEVAITTLDNLPTDMVNSLLKYEADRIHLYGNTEYALGIKNGILQLQDSDGLCFSEKNIIKVEVN